VGVLTDESALDKHKRKLAFISLMEETEPLLDIRRPNVIWRQVCDQMRGKILSGELPPGTKIPSTAAIAEQSQTDVKTVHRAMSLLVKEGLISRQRKIGTYVTERKKTISPIGIYSAMDLPTAGYNAFNNQLLIELQMEAQRRDLKTVVWNDPRKDEDVSKPLPEILDAVRGGEINSLIALHAHKGRLDWIRKLHIPASWMGSVADPTVTTDVVIFLDLALGALKKKGCRTVAVISNIDAKTMDQPFLELCVKHGLSTREEYIIHKFEHGEFNLERFGYEGFKKLWALTPFHPEGVVVFPDLSARGAIMAAHGSGARIGDDLHFAIHQNEGLEMFCPVPASLVMCSARDFAKAHIMQVERALSGQPAEPTLIRYRVVETPGCL